MQCSFLERHLRQLLFMTRINLTSKVYKKIKWIYSTSLFHSPQNDGQLYYKKRKFLTDINNIHRSILAIPVFLILENHIIMIIVYRVKTRKHLLLYLSWKYTYNNIIFHRSYPNIILSIWVLKTWVDQDVNT